MRKRYSRSYTVLSFLTMFSYREQPFTAPSLQSYFQVSILHMNYSEHHAHFEKHKQNSADTSDRQLTIF